jgi:hypothetical protein
MYAYHGPVPQLPEWTCSATYSWGYLQHRVTGAQIEYDLGDAPEFIGSCKLAGYFVAVECPGPVEARLRDLFPDGEACE